MEKLASAFKDVEIVRKSEENKHLYKKKGTVVLCNPETNTKNKFTYEGIVCQKDGCITKVYPNLESIEGKYRKTVRKILSRERKSREFYDFHWYYLKEL